MFWNEYDDYYDDFNDKVDDTRDLYDDSNNDHCLTADVILFIRSSS